MIDMHTHTWYSDGTLSPTQLVKMAKEKGIETLAITDHDGTFGLAEGEAAARELGIHFINGLEFSVELPVDEVGAMVYTHILGYGIDPSNGRLHEKILGIREQRKARNHKMLAALHELGYSLSKEEMQLYPGQDYIGKPNFARALVAAGYAEDVSEAFCSERMMASPLIKSIHRDKINGAEAIDLIKGAGGYAALAHPYQISYRGKWEDDPQVFFKKLTQTIEALVNLGLSGMECCYSSHSRKQESALLTLADKYRLTVTAGSDYHGPGMKKNVELGGVHGS